MPLGALRKLCVLLSMLSLGRATGQHGHVVKLLQPEFPFSGHAINSQVREQGGEFCSGKHRHLSL